MSYSCSAPVATSELSLRITQPAGYPVNAGRLDVNFLGLWGTTCSDGFSNVSAAIACIQLGYYGGYVIDGFGSGSGASLPVSLPIILDDVRCVGVGTPL